MRKNVLLIAAVVSMFVFSLQVAEPAAAAKLKVVDHGSVKLKDSYDGVMSFKWTTYQRGTNYVAMIGYLYSPQSKKGCSMHIYIQKLGKTLIKTYGTEKFKNYKTGHSFTKKLKPDYYYTKLTAARAYWRLFRPSLLAEMKKSTSS